MKQLSQEHVVDVLAFHQPALNQSLLAEMGLGVDDAIKKLNEFCRIKEVFPIPSDTHHFGRHLLGLKGLVGADGYTGGWLKSTPYKNAISRLLANSSYDLIHFDTISFFPYLRFARNTPTVLNHHNIESHMMVRRAGIEKNALKKWYFHNEGEKLLNIEKKFCGSVSHNIACSDIDAQRLRDMVPGASVSTIPNGVDTEYYCPDGSEKGQSLLFIGTMNWYPNIQAVEFLIREIWPALKDAYPSLRLDIIGASPPEKLTRLAAHESRIKFHGFVNDIRPHMNSALAFVCPIKDGGGTKLKVLDALAMALPLIADPVACEGIEVENDRSVLFAESPSDYVAAIGKVLAEQGLSARLGREGRMLIERLYSVSVVGKQLRDLYMEIAKRQ
jgi:polysaccharide biosynthesis protein PslH